MNRFKKLARAFTTWRNSKKSSPSPVFENLSKYFEHQRELNDLVDAQRYAMANHPLMNQTGAGMPAIGSMRAQNVTTASGIGPSMSEYVNPQGNMLYFSVEKVDNGYVLRSAKRVGGVSKVRTAADVNELRDQFITALVEHRMEE